MKIVNDLFDGYYALIVAALVILVPIWFGSFVMQALGVLFRRDRASGRASGRRGSRRAPSAPPR